MQKLKKLVMLLFIIGLVGCFDSKTYPGSEEELSEEPEGDIEKSDTSIDDSDDDSGDDSGDDSDDDSGEEIIPCPDACHIEDECIDNNAQNSENMCQICNISLTDKNWSPFNEDQVCGQGDFCTGDYICQNGDCVLENISPCQADEICENDIEKCCLPKNKAVCNKDGNYVWLDSCDIERETIEECDLENQICDEASGGCICEPGWLGKNCDQCVVFVNRANTTGNQNGLSWATAYSNLQDAIDSASKTVNCEVWVRYGTYSPSKTYEGPSTRHRSFIMQTGIKVYGGFSGNETSKNQRTLSPASTILSGSTTNSYHVVIAAEDALLDNFTISGGNADGQSREGEGGGVYNNNANFHINNCRIIDNKAIDGSAIYSYKKKLVIKNTLINNNKVDHTIYFLSGTVSILGGKLEMSQSVINSNSAICAGALYLHDAEAIIHNTEITNNFAYDIDSSCAGAIYSFLSNVELANTLITGNTAQQANAHALYINRGTMSIYNSTIYRNRTAHVGPGATAGPGIRLMSGTYITSNITSKLKIFNSIIYARINRQGTSEEEYRYSNILPAMTEGSRTGLISETIDTNGNCSGCINGGRSNLLPADILDLNQNGNTTEAIPVDLAGNQRVRGTNVDMGAFESQ